MANQIGKFFAPQGHDKAVAGVANHLTRFWDPSMRKKIVHHLDQGGEGLDPPVKEAVQSLRANSLTPPDSRVSAPPRAAPKSEPPICLSSGRWDIGTSGL
jgi:formate dehydrogenase subunit delta